MINNLLTEKSNNYLEHKANTTPPLYPILTMCTVEIACIMRYDVPVLFVSQGSYWSRSYGIIQNITRRILLEEVGGEHIKGDGGWRYEYLGSMTIEARWPACDQKNITQDSTWYDMKRRGIGRQYSVLNIYIMWLMGLVHYYRYKHFKNVFKISENHYSIWMFKKYSS